MTGAAAKAKAPEATEDWCILGTASASVAECEVGGAGEELGFGGSACGPVCLASPGSGSESVECLQFKAAGGRRVRGGGRAVEGREVGGSEPHV